MTNRFGARVIEVIETEIEKRGEGTEEDPIRRLTQYWSLDGRLLAEFDPCAKVNVKGETK